ncbi:hypothetical protein JCM19000A_42660 [Silvimonas sp. JCM 19000]
MQTVEKTGPVSLALAKREVQVLARSLTTRARTGFAIGMAISVSSARKIRPTSRGLIDLRLLVRSQSEAMEIIPRTMGRILAELAIAKRVLSALPITWIG